MVLVVLAVQVLVTIKVNLMVLQGQAVLVAVIMLEMAARVAQAVARVDLVAARSPVAERRRAWHRLPNRVLPGPREE